MEGFSLLLNSVHRLKKPYRCKKNISFLAALKKGLSLLYVFRPEHPSSVRVGTPHLVLHSLAKHDFPGLSKKYFFYYCLKLLVAAAGGGERRQQQQKKQEDKVKFAILGFHGEFIMPEFQVLQIFML